MRKLSLYRVLSRVTGEPRQRLQQMGFNLVRIIPIFEQSKPTPKRQRKEGQSRNT